MATREVGRGIGFNLSSEEGGDIGRFDQNYRLLQTAIKSSQTSRTYYGDTEKVEAGSGGVQRTVLVMDSGDNLSKARRAAASAETQISGKNSAVFGGVSEIPFHFFEGSINLKGDESKKILKAILNKFGGDIIKTLGDEVFFTYALNSEIVDKFKRQKKSPSKMFESKAFKEAREASLSYEIEQAQKEEAKEADAQAKQEAKQREIEDRKQKAFEQKERRAYNQEQKRIQRQIERLEGKTALDGRTYAEIFEASRGESAPVLTRKEELAAYKEIEAEDKKAKEEQSKKEKEAKEADASRRRTLGAVTKVIAGITLLTSIARRILTAVLDKASRDRAEAISGATLGVSAVDVRNYRNVERAKGLPEGSFMGLLSDLQANFGDPRHINEEALAEVAPYVPEAVVPLVRAGKMDLQELAKMILDSAQSRIEEGKDWSGEIVGTADSRRSILTSLARFSPHAKAIVENMVDTNAYGVFAGHAKGVDEYMEAGLNVRTKFTENELAQYKEVTQLVDGIRAQFKEIKDDIMVDIVRSFSGIANWLYNLDIGKSEESKLEDQIERQERIEQSKVEMTDIKASMRALIGSRLSGFDFTSLEDKDITDLDSMLAFMSANPAAFASRLQTDRKYSSLRNLLSSEDVLAMLGAYKVAEESYNELNKQSEKPIDEMVYKYSDYTQAGMAGRVKKDVLVQSLLKRASPWEAQQYAMSKNKYFKGVVSEPNPFDDFGEILTYIQEASDRGEAEWRDERMKQALDAFATRLQEKTGKGGISTFLDGSIAPKNAVEAVRNLRTSLKGAGYSLTEDDFKMFNEILVGLTPDLSKRVRGVDWELEGQVAPYQKALDKQYSNQLERDAIALFASALNQALVGALDNAKRQSEERGWDAALNRYGVSMTPTENGKLDIKVTVDNKAKDKGFEVTADSQLTTPTYRDKIPTNVYLNNWGK